MPAPVSVLALFEQITTLTLDERRQLFRRLRASGLLIADELSSDRARLDVAVSVRQTPRSAKSTVASSFIPANQPPLPAPAPKVPPPDPEPAPIAETVESPSPEPRPPEERTPEYRAPVSGRAVVHSPSEETNEPSPLMAPLPGQAPEQPIAIIFDGGSRGNPGEGYGSYQLLWPGAAPQIVRLRFGDRVTNNEAEYDTLIAALEAILKRLRDAHADPATAMIDIRGDSLLVINQVLGKWKVNEERMAARRDQVRTLLKRFGNWRLLHHDRANSVKALGH